MWQNFGKKYDIEDFGKRFVDELLRITTDS